jgi:hypothetical protein
MNAGAVPVMAGNRSSRKGFTQGPLLERSKLRKLHAWRELGHLAAAAEAAHAAADGAEPCGSQVHTRCPFGF